MPAPSPYPVDPGRPEISGARVPTFVVAILTGLGYYLGAYLIVNFALTPEGVAIV